MDNRKMGAEMEEKLSGVIERKRAHLKEMEERNNNTKGTKKLDSGMSHSDIGEISHISQMKMEHQSSFYNTKIKIEEGKKSIIIAEALDGICPCCHKNPISEEYIKQPLNLPICEECGRVCFEIRVKNNLEILDYLNLVIKEIKSKKVKIC
jgi:hypothetical protein